MDRNLVVIYFRTLAILAVLLLWGMSLLNGTVKALLLAIWNEKLNETIDLKTSYTRIPFIDYPISLLVAFFFYGTNGHNKNYQLFLLDAYSTLQPAFVWLYVEMARPGWKPKWIERPVIFGIFWQCFGAAISLPLYYAIHIAWADQPRVFRVLDVDMARAIPFSFLLGAVIPTVIGMVPTWNGPQLRAAEAHQNILAAWQPDPIWVSVIQMSLTSGLSLFRRRSGHSYENGLAFKWICTSYLIAAISSTLGHLYVISRVVASDFPAKSLVQMYVPVLFADPGVETDILVRGPWLFLQYDLIIISISSLSWAFILLVRVLNENEVSKGILLLIMLVGTLIIGPGATVSLVLFARERMLPTYPKESK